MIKFVEDGHAYSSLADDGVKWISATALIGKLHEKFNAEEQAPKSSVKKPTVMYPNKWYGMSVEEILKAWKGEGDRSTDLGHWYHSKRECELSGMDKVVMSNIVNGVKIALDQTLGEGVYPELLVYLLSVHVCGQADYVEVRNGKVYIRDYKTSKEIKRKGFTSYKGTKMMYFPVEHLEDCEFNHYSIQLSIYMYIILRHNPGLSPGTMIIEHIKFEVESHDKYGYPVYKRDHNGGFIVKGVEEIEVPYLRKEVQSIFEWLKENKQEFI